MQINCYSATKMVGPVALRPRGRERGRALDTMWGCWTGRALSRHRMAWGKPPARQPHIVFAGLRVCSWLDTSEADTMQGILCT